MARWERRAGSVLAWLATLPAALAWAAYAGRESAMAAVVDLPRLGLWLAVLGLVPAALGLLLLRRGPAGKPSRAAGAAAAVAAALALALLLGFRASYRAEEVRFAHGDVELAGTLYRPRGTGPHPAAVLVHGSGAESRRPYAFYGRYLARRGIAALAYDKRGVGESTGALYATDYDGYAADAAAAVRLLASRPEIDPGGVGLVGFSEGEWVAPLAAVRAERVAFVAVVGASGMTPAGQVATEMAMRLRASGHPDSVVARALDLNEQVFAYQRSGHGAQRLRAALAAAREEPWFGDADGLPDDVYPVQEYAWWRSVMDFDPAPVWERVSVPVLLLKGGRDAHSPPGPMRARIGEALARGGNAALAVRVFPAADHMLLEWPLGEGTPPPRFAEGALRTLVDWVRALGPRQGHVPQRDPAGAWR